MYNSKRRWGRETVSAMGSQFQALAQWGRSRKRAGDMHGLPRISVAAAKPSAADRTPPAARRPPPTARRPPPAARLFDCPHRPRWAASIQGSYTDCQDEYDRCVMSLHNTLVLQCLILSLYIILTQHLIQEKLPKLSLCCRS